jgi:hypothetical protein
MLIDHDYWKPDKALFGGYPWLTPQAIDFLEHTLRPGMDILELGSGGSTPYLARHCPCLVSIETDREWYKKVLQELYNKGFWFVEYSLVANLDQTMQVVGQRRFDLILIDCNEIDRVLCAGLARDRWLKPGGIIIIDNYDAEYCKGVLGIFPGSRYATLLCDDLHWAGKGTAIIEEVMDAPAPQALA